MWSGAFMSNNLTWLLVADASKARLYSIHKARVFQQQNPDELALVAEYVHADSRKKGVELATDKMGEFGSGTFVENTSPKWHAAEQFAHELLGYLESARKEGSYRDLIIVAPPAFMGLLHKHMPHEIHKLVSQKIEKDYTQNNPRELMQNLITHF
jgi:protein required for attachment to host cells